MPRDLWPHQKKAFNLVCDEYRRGNKWTCLVMATGCHRKGQLVLMYDGSTRAVEDIVAGDQLMGPDRTPRTVLALCRGRDEMFEIRPSDGGASWFVNGAHVLSLATHQTDWFFDITVRNWMRLHPTVRPIFRLCRLHPNFRTMTRFDVVRADTVEDYYGFTLDGDHRYLLDDFTVTHNSGKTQTGSHFVQVHVSKTPVAKVLWIAHREELVSQAYDTLAGMGLECGVIQAKPSRPVNPFRPVQVASVQTLMARELIVPDVSLFVYDECFVAGTPIELSDRTTVPIESLAVGDIVLARDDATGALVGRPVLRTFSSTPSALVRVNGLTCTPGHPFYVRGEGYVPAYALEGKYIERNGHPEYVERVEPVAVELGTLVYNIEVEEHHNYVAAGVVVHNCHHGASDGWSKNALAYKEKGAFGLGLTATPVRADGLPLGDIYDALVNPITMAQLIDQGFLVPFEMVRPPSPLKKGQIAQNPVEAYMQHAPGRKAVVFAANVVSATLFRDQFREAGLTAEIVTGSTDWGERQDILERYKSGAVQILCNVGVATEGFDDRPTSCVILARSVGSDGLYVQMCGRALRTSPETGKTNAILIDLHGSSYKHGSPADDREFTLDGDGIRKKKLEYGPERFCALCGVNMEQGAPICLECGSPSSGQLPPTVVGVKLVKYAHMRKRPDSQRILDLRKWLSECEREGYKRGRAYHKYKALYGEWPPNQIISQAAIDLS